MSAPYMVIFEPGTSLDTIEKYINQVEEEGGQIKHRYSSSLLGFSAILPSSALASLESNAQGGPIRYVEADGEVTVQS